MCYMLKYDDLTKEEKNLSILIVNNEIVLIGTMRECTGYLNKYLPARVNDGGVYRGHRIETLQELGEFSNFHAGIDSCYVGMEDCNGKDFFYEIISSPWYAYESSYVDEQGCSEEDIYKAFEQRRLDLRS